jgi:hypothetical protein
MPGTCSRWCARPLMGMIVLMVEQVTLSVRGEGRRTIAPD